MIDRDLSSDNVIDLLDRVLDKGIVIDASVRASAGIELLSVDARFVVASIAVCLAHVPVIRDVTQRSLVIATDRRSIGAVNSGGLRRRAGDRPLVADGPRRRSRRRARRRPRRPAN